MVRIVADSTCDLTKELKEKYAISILPLHTNLGGKEYLDGVDITPEIIYKWSDENKDTPKTSAPSITDAIEIFKSVLKNDDDEIIMFTISESMSTTANVCKMAAVQMMLEDRIHVVDSMNLSTGIGHLVVESAILASEGKDANYILNVIEEIKPRVRASFVVDTLVYLHRGGRCSSVSAFIGGALKLHPKIEVKEGKMLATKKYRGKMNRVILEYVDDMLDEIKSSKKDRVFITHSGCDKEVIDMVKKRLEELNHFDEIIETQAGSVISSHCGPKTLGVLYIK